MVVILRTKQENCSAFYCAVVCMDSNSSLLLSLCFDLLRLCHLSAAESGKCLLCGLTADRSEELSSIFTSLLSLGLELAVLKDFLF